RRAVDRTTSGDVVESAAQQPDGVFGPPGTRVRVAERGVDVGVRVRGDPRPRNRVLERGDRRRVIAAVRGDEAEPDARAGSGARVATHRRLREHVAEDGFGARDVVVESQRELGLPQPQLARRGVPELAAGLEVLHADAEAAGEDAKRLHRREPLSELDPRDVSVADAGAGERALGEPTLEAKAAESLPDRLG